MNEHVFISYSRRDGAALAERVAAALREGAPPCSVWVDQTDIRPGANYLAELDEAIKNCRCLVYLMTSNSTSGSSFCPNEVLRAMRYKKPIVPILAAQSVVPLINLEAVQHIDMTGEFAVGLAGLQSHLLWIETPAGQLQTALYYRAKLAHELGGPGADPKPIGEDLARLNQRIVELEQWLADPQNARKQKAIQIQAGMETERHAKDIATSRMACKFINSGAFVPPLHFQDRKVETKLAIEFLKHPSLRLLMIVGRGGVGKTGMVCRLLKGIEVGTIPDDLDQLPVAGIVYLSEQRTRRVSFPHLFEDLMALLDSRSAKEAERVYREAQTSTAEKMNALLSLLPEPVYLDSPQGGNPYKTGPVIVLLDNFEDLVSGGNRLTKDRELFDALVALLRAPANRVKLIVTTRVTPADLSLVVPAAYTEIRLDEGLPSPHAEELLKQLDNDGAVGLRSAAPEILTEAAHRVRGYPRALEALYAVLRSDRNASLEELLRKADAALSEEVVKVMVGEAFSRLERHEKLVVQALAIFNRPVPAVALDFLLQPFVPAIEAASILGWLVNLQMARKDRDRYYLHPVDAEFALAQIPDVTTAAEVPTDTIPMTRKALLGRAAEYFSEIRKPKAQWENILDLEPQLAEFDLLCRAERYDDAAAPLLAIGFNYLRTWGHIGKLLEMHERLRGRLKDSEIEASCLGILGTAYWDSGYLAQAATDLRSSIAATERTRGPIAAAAWWCNLGCCLRDMGRTEEALAAHEKALAVDHHFRDRSGVGSDLDNIAECYGDKGLMDLALASIDLGIEVIPLVEVDARLITCLRGFRLATRAKFLLDARRWEQATEDAQEALGLGQQIGNSVLTARASYYLALSSMIRGDLKTAREMAKTSLECEYPRFRFRALLLYGLIFLKLNEKREAEENFALCSKQCEELLSRCAEHYMARHHLALARCGLVACGQVSDTRPAKEILARCPTLKQYPGIRARCLRLLRSIAIHDSTQQMTRLASLIEGDAMELPEPTPPDHPVIEHAAVRELRAQLALPRLSKLHSQGFFESCGELAAGSESLVKVMSAQQRMEFFRMRAWAQARRGFLDGPGILENIQDPDYLRSLLRVTDYMAVYRFQGMTPAVELRDWVERGRRIASENPEDGAGAGVLMSEYFGCALLAEGDYGAAEQWLRKALTAENLGKKEERIVARIRAALGETYRLLGEVEKAEQLLENAAFQQEHVFDGDLCEYTLPHLAKLRAGEPSALDYLEQARICGERLQHRKALLRVLLIEARITQDAARMEQILPLARTIASSLPAVVVCPLWQRIQASWPEWCGGGAGPKADYWGL